MTSVAFPAQFTMETPEWYTPSLIVEPARRVLGGIDLDPASCAEANRIICAGHYFTEQENGLSKLWNCRTLFLNPPGGKVAEFWLKLVAEFAAGRIVDGAIWVGYSLEQLQTLQVACERSGAPTPLDYPICYPKKRIAFVENAAKKAARQTKQTASGNKATDKSSPAHGNYVAYLGNNALGFEVEFSPLGRVVL